MPSVKAHENAAGDVAIGFESEGVFVPVASISKARIGHAVERRQDLEKKASENDEIAAEALAGDFDAPKASNSESKSKEGGS